MSLVATLQAFFVMFLQFVGFGALLYFGFMRFVAPRLPLKYQNRVAGKHLKRAIGILGPNLALVRTGDGRYTLAPAEYDAENRLLWIDYGNEKKGYQIGGMGSTSLPFLNGNLSLVYEGLGAAADVVAAKIGREADANYGDSHSPTRQQLEIPAQGEIATDGGHTIELKEDEVIIPTSGVVGDLRNVMNLAPFNVRPEAFTRVEKNAKIGMSKFSNWSSLAQTGGMLGAFFLGALVTWWVSGESGGSAGGSVGEAVPVGQITTDLLVSGVIA